MPAAPHKEKKCVYIYIYIYCRVAYTCICQSYQGMDPCRPHQGCEWCRQRAAKASAGADYAEPQQVAYRKEMALWQKHCATALQPAAGSSNRINLRLPGSAWLYVQNPDLPLPRHHLSRRSLSPAARQAPHRFFLLPPYIPSRSRPHRRLVWWTVVAICEVKATCGCACLSSCYRVVGDLPQAPPHSLHKHPTSRLTDDASHGSRLILSSCHAKHGFANATSCLVRLQPCSCHSFQPGSCCKQGLGLWSQCIVVHEAKALKRGGGGD